MTSVSLFQFSLCFKSPEAPRLCGVFVCMFFWLFFSILLPHLLHATNTVKLQASLSSELNAAAQIKTSFGKYSIEAPDLFKKISGQSERIRIVKDKEIKSAFEFLLHRDLDGDRDKTWPIGKERQRNEIKGYQGSVDALKGYEGQTHQIKWHLKIEETFKVTKEFCHFFQLKAVGTRNVDAPILTLSGVVRKGTQQLQLQCWKGNKSEKHFLADWEACLGKWLQCTVQCQYGKMGSYKFSVNSLDGSIEKEINQKDFPSWREGFEFVRPKWGIYRSLATVKNQLNPVDSVYLNHFSILKR